MSSHRRGDESGEEKRYPSSCAGAVLLAAAASLLLSGIDLRADDPAGGKKKGRKPKDAAKAPMPERPEAEKKPDAVALFNGRDLDGWKPRDPNGSNWVVGRASIAKDDPTQLVAKKAKNAAKAELINTKGGSNICTTERFGDCTIELEFLVAKGTDSGVYVMGEYEVQIFDSVGKQTLEPSDLGGVFAPSVDRPTDAKPPAKNAAKEPGQWQRMTIEFRAPKFKDGKKVANARFLKIAINGQVVQENAEINAPNVDGLTGNEAPTGPLMLQGMHGAVAFRNICVAAK